MNKFYASELKKTFNLLQVEIEMPMCLKLWYTQSISKIRTNVVWTDVRSKIEVGQFGLAKIFPYYYYR